MTEYKRLVKLLTDASLCITTVDILHDNMLKVTYRAKEPEALKTENVILALFTTAHARLRLYGVMEELHDAGGDSKLLYTDTDSVFYVQRSGERDPECGPFLGDLVDEYPDRKIVSFHSAGPKSYTYTFADGGSITKVKGLTLNF